MKDFELAGIQATAAKITEALGLRLYDLEFNDISRTLKVMIDKAEGISINDCTRVSAALSRELDLLDLIHGHYQLEVSSPGINRFLKRLEHYQWAVGKSVRIETAKEKITGYLRGADEESVTLATPAGEKIIPRAEIAKAQVMEDIADGKRR